MLDKDHNENGDHGDAQVEDNHCKQCDGIGDKHGVVNAQKPHREIREPRHLKIFQYKNDEPNAAQEPLFQFSKL